MMTVSHRMHPCKLSGLNASVRALHRRRGYAEGDVGAQDFGPETAGDAHEQSQSPGSAA